MKIKFLHVTPFVLFAVLTAGARAEDQARDFKAGPAFNRAGPGSPPRLPERAMPALSSANTWSLYPISSGDLLAIEVDPLDPRTVYAGTRAAGVYKSTNSGLTWQAARQGLTFWPIRSLAIDPVNSANLYAGTDYDGIWRSTDSGASWFESNAGFDDGLIVTNLVVDALNPATVYAGIAGGNGFTIGQVYRSTDHGANWQVWDNGIPRESNNYINAVFSLAMDPDEASVLYCGTCFDGVYKTTSGGAAWFGLNDSLPTQGPNLYEPVNALCVDPHRHRPSGLVRGDYWVYENSFWRKINQTFFPNDPIFWDGLFFHPANANVVFSTGNVYTRSSDAGVNWTQYLGWPSSGGVEDAAFNRQSPDTMFCATTMESEYTGGAYKSANQGLTWTPSSAGITASVINCVAINPANPGIIYCGEQWGHFYRSTNAGLSWSMTDLGSSDVYDIEVDPAQPLTIYACAEDLQRSTDGGQTFSEITQVAISYCVCIPPGASSMVFCGTSFSGVWRSTDAGSTWSQVNNGLTSSNIRSLEVDPGQPSTVWAGTWGDGVFRSTNSGGAWQAMGLDDEVHVDAIAVDPADGGVILAGTSGGKIYKSTDAGATWTAKLTGCGNPYQIKHDPRDRQFVYAATEGSGVLRSTDGGETWSDFSAGIFCPVMYSIDAAMQADSALLVAGSYGSGLYWMRPNLMGCEESSRFRPGTGLAGLEVNPSPCRGVMTVRYFMPRPASARIDVYDVRGRTVRNSIDASAPAGERSTRLDIAGLSSGIYFCRLEVEGSCVIKKFVVLK